MRKSLFLPVLLITVLSCRQTGGSNMPPTAKKDSASYLAACIDFLQQVAHRRLNGAGLILSDAPSLLTGDGCLKEVLADTNFYTKEELSYLRDRQYPSLQKWPEKLIPNTRVLRSDSIQAVFERGGKDWMYFYNRIGSGVHGFSMPVFLRNDTYCLFYSEYNCGMLCGEGDLTLYKKENSQWKPIKQYCAWIS
ncbi:hypothetical protein [Sediminibacterium soli]|uniref:hypothetical protein n=1 Tax=Sediminibacterium soli TaxID=2698829 RepID=UPI00137AB77F|nr:hypothetical protein [Sediminibacterium soli]NCI45726.1 hypothetical protein [Sediminibacterium soli]